MPENLVNLTVRIESEAKDAIQKRAAARGISAGEYLRAVIARDLAETTPPQTAQWFREMLRDELERSEIARMRHAESATDEMMDMVAARCDEMLGRVLDAAGASVVLGTVAACGGASTFDRERVAEVACGLGRKAAAGIDFSRDLEDAGI